MLFGPKEHGLTYEPGRYGPQPVSAGGHGYAYVSRGLTTRVKLADICQRVRDDPAVIVVGPVIRTDKLDLDIEPGVTGVVSL
jgi:hypothetical protein